MLNSCVRLSIVARTGMSTPSTSTVGAPIGGAGIGSVGSSSASQPFERAIDGGRQLGAQPHRADVVLGEDVAAHLQPQPHARRIAVGVLARASAA